MTVFEFEMLCGRYAIDPALALENDAIRAALKAHDAVEVERILKEEF